MLVVVSSLTGGEACGPIADALTLAAAGHRTVHVVLPTIEQLEDLRPQAPGSLGHQPTTCEWLGNMEKLADASRFGAFHDELLTSGIHVHRLDNTADIDGVITDHLTAEVLSAWSLVVVSWPSNKHPQVRIFASHSASLPEKWGGVLVNAAVAPSVTARIRNGEFATAAEADAALGLAIHQRFPDLFDGGQWAGCVVAVVSIRQGTCGEPEEL